MPTRYDFKLTPENCTCAQFKIGDKVYVHPGEGSYSFKHYLRATIDDIGNCYIPNIPKCYLLRAFKQDLPGLYMFNIWDCDLIPRKDKSNKILPSIASKPNHLPSIFRG